MGSKSEPRDLPSVNELLGDPAVAALIDAHGRDVVKHAVRSAIDDARAAILDGAGAPEPTALASSVIARLEALSGNSLKPVVNATGVVIHTNLGRSPLGRSVIDEVSRVALGYSNLEFDLAAARRGQRSAHVAELLRYLTGAEEIAVVNNNAAGIILALRTLAFGREVIVSRGELIEIGGSFRIPEIMAASGATMVEVGATNRTRLADYEAAIGENSALLFKAHKSNYAITGFTEEVPAKKLAKLAHSHGLPLVFDLGSGLLRRPAGLPLEDEPDVAGAIADGADVVLFSCDKLLGGPQAGIIAGRRDPVAEMAGAPLMRALRVGKLTLAALSAACKAYLTDERLRTSNPTFAMLSRNREELQRLASLLRDGLARLGVAAEIAPSRGQCGGGSLPGLEIETLAVEVTPSGASAGARSSFAETLFARLLDRDRPVLGVLREGRLFFDVLTLAEEDVAYVAEAIAEAQAPEVTP